jgi:hypothetical protein
VRLAHFILVDREPVEVDFMTWVVWFEDIDNRQIKYTQQGDVWVSTIFVGLDHNYSDRGPPNLFETMAFVGDHSVGQERYATLAEAEEGHARAVAEVFKATPILAMPEKAT